MLASRANMLPVVYIIFGLPGSGKSYFASRWAEYIHAPYVNSDKVRKEMYRLPVYSAAEKKSVYQQLLIEMNKAIAGGGNIVLDATFSDNSMREIFEQQARGKAVLQFIEIRADEPVIRERLKAKRLFSDADYEVYMKLKEEWHEFDKAHLILYSTNDNIDELLRQAKAHFSIENPAAISED
jgi:predicted kinase